MNAITFLPARPVCNNTKMPESFFNVTRIMDNQGCIDEERNAFPLPCHTRTDSLAEYAAANSGTVVHRFNDSLTRGIIQTAKGLELISSNGYSGTFARVSLAIAEYNRIESYNF